MCGNSEDLTRHPGHLKPFASHGKILNVESLDYFPDPRVFFPNYVHGSKPLHIRGGAKISPAYSLWSDEYFLKFEEGNDVTVVVEQAKKENRTLPAEEIPFTEFVKRYRKEDIYLVNDLPDFLRYAEVVACFPSCYIVRTKKQLLGEGNHLVPHFPTIPMLVLPLTL